MFEAQLNDLVTERYHIKNGIYTIHENNGKAFFENGETGKHEKTKSFQINRN